MLGNFGDSCMKTCSKTGRVCNIEAQSALNSDKLVAEKMAEAGYNCKGFHKARGYAGSPFATGRNDDCSPITKGKKSICSENRFKYHRALCYCEKNAEDDGKF